jgi:fluoride exporter
MPAPDGSESADPLHRLPVDPDVAESDLTPSRVHTTVLAVIALGGALGALARWLVAEGIPHDAGQFPWDTLLTNVAGCFLIGVLMVLVIERWPGRPLIRPFFGTGFLGGFTTFSTYAVDTRTLLAADRPGVAFAYLAGTLALGLVAVVVGLRAAERAVRR